MMNLLIHDNHIAWPALAALVYLTALLPVTDYVWRTSRLGGKAVFLGAGMLALVGCSLILWIV